MEAAFVTPTVTRSESTAAEAASTLWRPKPSVGRTEPSTECLWPTAPALRGTESAATPTVAHHAALRPEAAMSAESVRTAPAMSWRAAKAVSAATHHASWTTAPSETSLAAVRWTGESAGAEIASTDIGTRMAPIRAGSGRLPPLATAIRAVVSTGLRPLPRAVAISGPNDAGAGHGPRSSAAAIAIFGSSPGDHGVGRARIAEYPDQLLP